MSPCKRLSTERWPGGRGNLQDEASAARRVGGGAGKPARQGAGQSYGASGPATLLTDLEEDSTVTETVLKCPGLKDAPVASRRKAPNSIWLPQSMWGTQLPRDLSPDGWPSCRPTTHLCWAASLSLKLEAMDFLGGPVVMHTPCNAGYAGSILGQGAKNLCASTTEAVL